MILDCYEYTCNQAEVATQDYSLAMVAWDFALENWQRHRTGEAYEKLMAARERRFHAWDVYCYWTGRSQSSGAR